MSSRIGRPDKSYSRASSAPSIDKTLTEFNNHLVRLGFNMDELKFAEGFANIHALMTGIAEGKFQKDIGAFQGLNRYLGEQKRGIKQSIIATRLKNFCDEYKQRNSSETIRGNVGVRVDATLTKIRNLVTRFRDNYSHEVIRAIYSYKLTLDINPNDSPSKEADRDSILKKLFERGIFVVEDVEFLKNHSNFGAFVREVTA